MSCAAPPSAADRKRKRDDHVERGEGESGVAAAAAAAAADASSVSESAVGRGDHAGGAASAPSSSSSSSAPSSSVASPSKGKGTSEKTKKKRKTGKQPDNKRKRFAPHTSVPLDHYLPSLVVNVDAAHKKRVTDLLEQVAFKQLPQCAGPFVETNKVPHLIFVKSPDADALMAWLTAQPLVIVRSLRQVYRIDKVTRTIDEMVDGLGLASGDVVTLRVHPRSAAEAIAAALRVRGVTLSLTLYTHTLHVVFAYRKYYHSVRATPPSARDQELPELRLVESRQVEAEGGPPVSRAYFKLAEVFYRTQYDPVMIVFRERLRARVEAAGGDLSRLPAALDIGASPGGWSAYCAAVLGLRVVAVDSGELRIKDTDKGADRITHIPKLFGDAVTELTGHAPFDLCVCDANIKADQVVPMLLTAAEMMSPGALLVLTIKHVVNNHHHHLMRSTKEALHPAFEGVAEFWLLANSKRERTLVAWRRAREDN